jgi:predicted small lipoprotein YifL
MIRQLPVALLLATLAACGGDKSDQQAVNRDTLTQRQKDSILAKSSIPGASNVGRAMRAADSTSAGAHRADSVAADTTER